MLPPAALALAVMVLVAASLPCDAAPLLRRSFCDCKTALNTGTLNETNAESIVSALVSLMRCNGLRIPLLPSLKSPAQYSVGYNETIKVARAMNLTLYASPMEGAWNDIHGGEKAYAAWVSSYAAAYGPHFLSAFNEVGSSNCDASCMGRVVADIRAAPGVPTYVRYVGPDDEHLSSTLTECKRAKDFRGVFDVLSSHNAGEDSSATLGAWSQLVEAGGGQREVWSSENPACFKLATCTTYSTLTSPINAGVQGLVTWETLGNDVTLAGTITEKGADIAAGLPPTQAMTFVGVLES